MPDDDRYLPTPTDLHGRISRHAQAPESNTLTVYWRGAPSLVEQGVLQDAKARGLRVELVPARYSRVELDAQVAAVEQDAKSTGAERVAYITKNTDGSGITVGVASRHVGVGMLGTTLPHLRAAAQRGSVTVKRAADDNGALLRENDTAPFYGGAQIFHNSTTGTCTSGFAVRWQGQDIPLGGTRLSDVD